MIAFEREDAKEPQQLSGWKEEVSLANAQRLEKQELLDLLELLRAGDLSAKPRLIDGMKWLVYQEAVKLGDRPRFFKRDGRKPGVGLYQYSATACGALGEYYFGLLTVIDRLAKNTVTDPEKHLLAELGRIKIDVARENKIANDLLPPPSTLCAQRKRARADEFWSEFNEEDFDSLPWLNYRLSKSRERMKRLIELDAPAAILENESQLEAKLVGLIEQAQAAEGNRQN